MVISPTNLCSSSTMGNFSTLFSKRIFFASSRLVSLCEVMRLSFVIRCSTFMLRSSWYLTSLLVMIPMRLFSSSTTGRPEILYLAIISFASPSVWFLERVTGSAIMPFSDRFTLLTCAACSSMVIFL